MSTTIDTTALVAQHGAYYEEGASKQERLFSETYRSIKEIDAGILTLIRTNDTIWKGADSILSDILQAFQEDYTPNGDLEFIPIKINLFNVKIDLKIFPDKIKETWAGFLSNDSINREEWPFARWIIEMHILPKLKENIGVTSLYKGVYVAPTVGVAGPAVASFDGLEKYMDDAVIAGDITPIVLGAVPTDPESFVTYVEDFMDAIPEKYNNNIRTVQMSESLARRYSRGYYIKYGKSHRDDGSGLNTAIANYNAMVVGLPSMAGKTRIWATVPTNGVLVAKGWDNHNQISMVKDENPRKVKIFSDFFLVPAFVLNRLAFMSDQT